MQRPVKGISNSKIQTQAQKFSSIYPLGFNQPQGQLVQQKMHDEPNFDSNFENQQSLSPSRQGPTKKRKTSILKPTLKSKKNTIKKERVIFDEKDNVDLKILPTNYPQETHSKIRPQSHSGTCSDNKIQYSHEDLKTETLEEENFDNFWNKKMRKRQSYNIIFLIFLSLLSTQWTAVAYMLYTADVESKLTFNSLNIIYMFGASSLVSFCVVWGYGYDGVKQFVKMHILLDNVLLVCVISCIGFIGMLSIAATSPAHDSIIKFVVPFEFFSIAGTCRLYIKWTILRPWKVILIKISLGISATGYFMTGAYFMYVDYKMTDGWDEDMDQKFKDFVLLFVFSNFAFSAEIYSMITRFDQTEILKADYKIILDTERQAYLHEQKSQKSSNGYNRARKGSHQSIESIQSHQKANEQQKSNYEEVYIRQSDGSGFRRVKAYHYDKTDGKIKLS